jgi:hypothetical protein
VVVGDNVASLIPDEAGAALLLYFLPARCRHLGAAADDLDHRGRDPFEQLDGSAFKIGKIATRLNWTRIGRRVELIVNIRAGEINGGSAQN